MKTIVVCSGGLDSVSLAYTIADEAELWRLVTANRSRHGPCVERDEVFPFADTSDPDYWPSALSTAKEGGTKLCIE